MLKLILGVYMGLTRAYLIGCYMHIRKNRQNKKRNGGNKISNLGIDKQNYWIYNNCKGKTYKGVRGLRERD